MYGCLCAFLGSIPDEDPFEGSPKRSLLKKKADALSLRFRDILKKIVHNKIRMGEVMKEAAFCLTEAKFTGGDFAHTVTQNVKNPQYRARTKKDNVVGVILPVFEAYQDDPDTYDLTGLGKGGPNIAKLKKNYQKAVELLVEFIAQIKGSIPHEDPFEGSPKRSLLKKKADALNLRFRDILKKIVHNKILMGEVMKEAAFSLAKARFAGGDFAHTVTQNVKNPQYRVRTKKDNVVGVILPVFKAYQDGPDTYDLTGLGKGGPNITKLKKNYQKAVELLAEFIVQIKVKSAKTTTNHNFPTFITFLIRIQV
uniref:DNA-directed DNA polymerase n=1 Tax=Rhabditophanes sp. KR3021 TaxID=114890 RepID=A0AC35U224_9BILA